MIAPSGKFPVMEPKGAEDMWNDVRTRNAGADSLPFSFGRDPELDTVRCATESGVGGRAMIAAVQHYLRRGQPRFETAKEQVLKAKCVQRFLSSTMTFKVERTVDVATADGEVLTLPPVPRVRVASEAIWFYARMPRNLQKKNLSVKAHTVNQLTEKVLVKALEKLFLKKTTAAVEATCVQGGTRSGQRDLIAAAGEIGVFEECGYVNSVPKLCENPLEAAHHLLLQEISWEGCTKQRWQWRRDLSDEVAADPLLCSAKTVLERYEDGDGQPDFCQRNLEEIVKKYPTAALFYQVLMPILRPADVKARMVAKQSQVNTAPVVELVVDLAKKELFGMGCRRPNHKEPLPHLLERTAEVQVGHPSTSCLLYDAPQATDRKQSPDAVGASVVLCDFFSRDGRKDRNVIEIMAAAWPSPKLF